MGYGLAYERGHPIREQRRVSGIDRTGVSGYAGIDRLVAQQLELLWNRLEKIDAKRVRALDEPARRLIRADLRRIVERACRLGKCTALRRIHVAQHDRI